MTLPILCGMTATKQLLSASKNGSFVSWEEFVMVDCYIEVDTSSGNMAKGQLPTKKSTEICWFPTYAKKQQFQ